MIPIELILLVSSLLVFLSILASKLSYKIAVPSLLLFIAVGMLAGSEGIGGIYFNDPALAKSIGIIALIFIIFSGGIDTNWGEVRPVVLPGVLLSTLGVLLTAIITGLFAVYILKFTFLEGLLLGSIVSSTDAAAVFSILRSKRISLKPPLKPLLEFESGSNDPMAVFLTLTVLGMITANKVNFGMAITSFFWDMAIGAIIGYAMARVSIFVINRINLEYDGLYPVLTISLVMLTYSLASFVKSNGFIAVYLAGLIMSNQQFMNKRIIVRFHDGVAWLMQIAMFLTLGLLVFPSQLIPVCGVSVLIAFILMLVARPASVFLCLLPFGINLRKKTMVAWVGLRGAVPVVLATFPLLAGIPQAGMIFNVVFFVVLTSVLVQGASIPFVSKILKTKGPPVNIRNYPIEFQKTSAIDADLTDIIVPYSSSVAGKPIYKLGLGECCLIALISRNEKFIIPNGSTVIEPGDVLLVLSNKEDFKALQKKINETKGA
ncbi:MAG: potassium/proton antiporter [Candidatus Omnitrophica bacterium]|nr:potassium/proton antiporter [Candidatus Omnitrophota bacterium]